MAFRSHHFFSNWIPAVMLFISILLVIHSEENKKHQLISPADIAEIEDEKSDDKLEPNEQFFYDRNYPATSLNYEAYRRLLETSMDYDRNHPPTRRGLDAPWIMQGPGNIGGRVNTIAVSPIDPKLMLLGYSQGGIYRTSDGGQTWIPVFDDKASLSISDIQFDPADATHIWATTGDVNISGYYFIGNGIYESRDSGLTWQNKGLGGAGILSKVAIDNNPNYIYAGSMGFPAYKSFDRGLYRSTNGGNNWEKTLTIDDSTGIIDIVADRSKTGRVFATSFTRLRSNVLGSTRCSGTSVYKSEDFGATWVNVKNGLPENPHSRTNIEITNNGTLFVSYINSRYCDDKQYSEELKNIYRSTDSGLSWDTIPTGRAHNLPCEIMGQNGWYFDAISVNPNDPEDIFILGVMLYRSRDGGLYWQLASPDYFPNDVHVDEHCLVFGHDHVFMGTDGGAYSSLISSTDEWKDIENIPSTQFYRTTFNPHQPDQYFGGAQDNGTTGGNEANFNSWPRIYGGDGFQPLYVSTEPEWAFALTQNGFVWFQKSNGDFYKKLVTGLTGTRYWDMPFVASYFDPKILFCGSNQLFTIDMKDNMPEWKSISPDLTKGMLMTGGKYPALTAIAQSPKDELRMYAGTQDGLVWTTADGGQNWTNISAGTPGAFVTSISCSLVDPQGVFITHSGFRDEDHHAYIYQSNDAGAHWETIGTNFPMMGVNNLFIMPGSDDKVLIVGADNGVYVSFDSGDQWDRVGSNMPYFPVYDIDFNPVTNQVVAATFARGIITFPLDQLELETGVIQSVMSLSDHVIVYPTIVKDEVFLNISDPEKLNWPLHIDIMDRNGVRVERHLLDKGIKENLKFNHPLVPGLYFLVIQSGSKWMTQKIILQ